MNFVRRWLPRPLLTLFLWAVWLLLQNSLSLGQILLGFGLAILIPRLTERFWSPQPDLRRPWRAVRFLCLILYDIVTANFQVARRVLGPVRELRPAFVEVPLDLTRDYPITLLASIISLTPGTVSAQLSSDRRHLLIHVLHLQEDEEALIRDIKQRYELALKEIFEC